MDMAGVQISGISVRRLEYPTNHWGMRGICITNLQEYQRICTGLTVGSIRAAGSASRGTRPRRW